MYRLCVNENPVYRKTGRCSLPILSNLTSLQIIGLDEYPVYLIETGNPIPPYIHLLSIHTPGTALTHSHILAWERLFVSGLINFSHAEEELI